MIQVTDKEGNFHFYTQPEHLFYSSEDKIFIHKKDPEAFNKTKPGEFDVLVGVFFNPISCVVCE